MTGRVALFALPLLFLNLVLIIFSAESTVITRRRSSPNPNNTNQTEFIKSSCRATRYPAVCVQTLTRYAHLIRQNDKQLAITALAVSVSMTKSSASFMRKMAKVKGMLPREHGAVQDCKENMESSVDRLNQSVKELGLKGADNLVWRMSNVQTWVSAALTDQSTCLDGFGLPHMDGKLKDAVRGRVVGVSQVTSNALALVNRFASSIETP